MTVIIGHTGFLGSRLTADLAGRGPVTTIGRTGSDLTVDLRSDAGLDTACRLVAGQDVFYCANVGGRDVARADPSSAWLVNAVAPARLAAAATRFMYFSTDYIFSEPGTATEHTPTSPRGVYAESKARGEEAVLAASATAQVVRVSGLFDVHGQRGHGFAVCRRRDAADNRVSTPTYVPDLVKDVTGWSGGGRIRHVVGPDALSHYEFAQIASLRWGFDVAPTLAVEPRDAVIAASPGVTIRSPADVFAAGTARSEQPRRAVLVLDCVGVVLSGRRWRHPDPAFWTAQSAGPDAPLRAHGADVIVGAYCPDPRGWSLLRPGRRHQLTILANNGPWETFGRWLDRYGFASLCDIVINSERDGLTKPQPQFRVAVEKLAQGLPITLIDDRADIVHAAATWGWTSSRTQRVAAWPVEQFAPQESTHA